MTGLMYNEDFGRFIFLPREDVRKEVIDAYVDRLAAAGVTHGLICTCARRTNYASEVWEAIWDGYDPEGPDDQPFLRGYAGYHDAGRLQQHRREMDTVLEWGRQGIDVPASWLARCRERGVSAWVSLRMNDVHGNECPDRGDHSTFWKEHPEYRRGPFHPNRRESIASDYAHDDVRQHYRRVIEEQLDRYDIDGMELDFMRHAVYFRLGRELAGGAIMTAWLAEIRELVKAAAERRGHSIELAVRVPSRPDTARRLGLDAVTWAKNALIDWVIPTASVGAITTEFDMPIHLWRDLLEPCGVKLAGCVEPGVLRYPGAGADPATPETAAGSAVAVLAGGADALYLFNYFPDRLAARFGWTAEQFDETLKAMASPETLYALPRRHAITFRECLAPGELVPRNNLLLFPKLSGGLTEIDSPLPVIGSDLVFRLQTGPRPAGRKVQVVIGLEKDTGTSLQPPRATVNGVPCPLSDGGPGDELLTYDVPEEALADEEHVIGLAANQRNGNFIKVTRVEFVVGRA